jgi:ABC-2 type transport system ATP-binding protein
MADRVGVISHGKIILVEDKTTLMKKLGKKQLTVQLKEPLTAIPASLAAHALSLNAAGTELTYAYDPRAAQGAVATLLDDLSAAGIRVNDLQTTQSSLEDIFVNLVKDELVKEPG